jgi:hypothetical protein
MCTYKNFEEEDPLLSDDLWRAQFLQIMGCELGYDDVAVRESIDEAYNLIMTAHHGNKFFDEAHKLGVHGPLAVFLTKEDRTKEMDVVVLQSYFGWPTMDLIHNILRKLKTAPPNSQLEWSEWQAVLDTYRADCVPPQVQSVNR